MIRNLIVATCILLFAACGKDTESKLGGKWQLQEVETGGNIQHVDTIYFNFQHSLFQYQVYSPTLQGMRYSYGFNMIEDDDKLFLELTDNPQPVHVFLPLTDWTSAKRVYTIEKSTVKQLVLSYEGTRYIFRKF